MIFIKQLEGEPLVEAEEDQAPRDEDDQVVQEEEPVEVAENVQDFDEPLGGEPQGEQRQPPEPDPERPSTSSRTFRVNSPSYQAVQHEFEVFERIRNEASGGGGPNTGGFVWRDSPPVPGTSIAGPLSPCVSPDRYPFSWSSSPGYSPSPSSSRDEIQ